MQTNPPETPKLNASGILLGERNAPTATRLISKIIDLVLIAALFYLGKVIALPIGLGAAILYALFQDALGRGQSIGKRLCGLKVVDIRTEEPCSFQQSFLRNFPLALGLAFSAFSLLWVFLALLVVPVCVLEVYLVTRLITGIRLGDVLGHTVVKEAEPPFIVPAG
jgi:uncharacterized RDD family membrane protein YckC